MMKILLPGLLLSLLTTAGCVSKSKAKAEAQAAFLAGQQQALTQMSDPRRINIRILGPVRYPEITWAEGLTLSQVITDADYLDKNTPREIVIVRPRGRFPIDPQALLQGEIFPMEPGDLVEIRP